MIFKTSNGREVTIADARTRKLDREYQEAISDGVMVSSNGGDMNFPAKNAQRANDILVMGMTGLSQDEIDALTSDEFNEVLTEILAIDQKKSQAKNSSALSEVVSKGEVDNTPKNT